MDYLFLSTTPLFLGISPQEIEGMMHCLKAVIKKYRKGQIIHYAGEKISTMGLILKGSVSIEVDDVWGNKSILDKISAGNVFAENYACLPAENLMVNITADESSEILFLSTDCMFTVCANACSFHNQLIRNMLTLSAYKSLNLSRRILHTSSKSIRGRLLSYLSFLAAKQGSREFDVPFNRQQLADYLSVDRSAMSNELSKMQRDGLLLADRNHFILHITEDEYE